MQESKDRVKVLLKHYYLQLLFGIAFLITAAILAQTIHPEPRPITDPTKYKEPFKPFELVPFPMLIALCVVVPVILIASFTIAIGDLELFFAIATVLFVAFGVCFLTTETLKLTVRRPRPYVQYEIPLSEPNYSYLKDRMDRHYRKEGFKSFPSGHTSNGICGTLTSLLFFLGQIRPFHSERAGWKTCLMSLVMLIPLGVAIYVGITRVLDNRHHVSDVLCGALIGAIGSLCSYFGNFNSTWHPQSNVPRFSPNGSKEFGSEEDGNP